jgi:hypothetical protein
MKSIRIVCTALVLVSSGLAQLNPVPQVNQPLVPMSAAPGGADFALTVNGTGFVTGSVVNWNKDALQTTLVSTSRLTAVVSASEIATASTATVTVVNPAPGGGISNASLFPIRQPFGAVSFDRSSFATAVGPMSLVVADLNGDGNLDIVSVDDDQNNGSSAVSVLLGNGDGTFQSHVDYPLPDFAAAGVLGDFNGDGKLDLAVSIDDGFVSILLGNGDGTFQQHEDFAMPIYGTGLTAGDFNGDGKLDVAVAIWLPVAQVAIMLGNGDGTLQGPTNVYTIGSGEADGVVAGDFNGDGNLDLAVAVGFDADVAVLLGNGDGTFQNPVDYSTAEGPQTLIAADLNGDGNLDLAVQTFRSASNSPVSVLLGNGDGTFRAHVDYRLPTKEASGIAVADLNGDGKPDLVVSSFLNPVITFLGKGDGTFRRPGDFPTGQDNLTTAALGDFNGDGMIDVVAAALSNTVTVMKQATAVLSNTQLDFGKVKVGFTVTRKVTLSNIGSTSFTINAITLTGKKYRVSSDCGTNVPPGAACTISIFFRPAYTNRYNAAVQISDSAVSAPQEILLRGLGIH